MYVVSTYQICILQPYVAIVIRLFVLEFLETRLSNAVNTQGVSTQRNYSREPWLFHGIKMEFLQVLQEHIL
jgi:hypothetical protein